MPTNTPRGTNNRYVISTTFKTTQVPAEIEMSLAARTTQPRSRKPVSQWARDHSDNTQPNLIHKQWQNISGVVRQAGTKGRDK